MRTVLSAMGTSEVLVHPLSTNALFTEAFDPAEIAQAYAFGTGGEHQWWSRDAAAGNWPDHRNRRPLITIPTSPATLRCLTPNSACRPPPSLKIVNQTGSATKLPAVNPDWAFEIALDVQWAHAMAPGASILVVEAASNRITDMMTAVDTARKATGVTVVTMSWGASEFSGQTAYDKYFTTPAKHPGVSFVAASGDYGSPGTWPAFSSNVLAVGGTSLATDSSGNYLGETGWSGSGGGDSRYVRQPKYQSALLYSGLFARNLRRAIPDVAYNSDPNTGYLVYNSVPYAGQTAGGSSEERAPARPNGPPSWPLPTSSERRPDSSP